MTSPQIEPPAEIVEKSEEIVDLLRKTRHLPSALVMNVEPIPWVPVSSDSRAGPTRKMSQSFSVGNWTARQ